MKIAEIDESEIRQRWEDSVDPSEILAKVTKSFGAATLVAIVYSRTDVGAELRKIFDWAKDELFKVVLSEYRDNLFLAGMACCGVDIGGRDG